MQAIDLEKQSERSMTGLGNLVDRTAPWLFEVGSWVFGGLTALNLVITAALLTVGPADIAIRISIAAFACALPLNVAGICLLRLTKDTHDNHLDDVALEAFQSAGFPNIEAYFPPAGQTQSLRQRRARVVLRYSLGLAALSTALTMTGTVAALWHMAWWVGVELLAMTMISAVAVLAVLGASLPPDSASERELKRRYAEQRAHPTPEMSSQEQSNR